jgi:hypothetical protein
MSPSQGRYLKLPRAAVLARQTRSFVYALITVFVSSIQVRQTPFLSSRETPKRHKTVSNESFVRATNRSHTKP